MVVHDVVLVDDDDLFRDALAADLCMDRRDSEQVFGDMVNTPKEWIHEVFDAVPEQGREPRGAVSSCAGAWGEPSGAVSSAQGAATDSVQVAGSLPARGGWRLVGPLAAA